MNSARPDLEYVRGRTIPHATAEAIANHGGALRSAKRSTAAQAPRVRKRAVMLGSAKVMLRRWATAGFGAQIWMCARYRTAPNAATASADPTKAVHARRSSSRATTSLTVHR